MEERTRQLEPQAPCLFGRNRSEHENDPSLRALATFAAVSGQAAPRTLAHTNTFIAALRHDRLEAPWMLEGAMNGQAFLIYLGEILEPTLREGDVVICDNLSSHKIAGAEETIRQTGASLRYLPPYSPDLNPIEMAFSKLKALIRKQNARSFPELFKAVAYASRSFPSTHCTGFFRHANYATD